MKEFFEYLGRVGQRAMAVNGAPLPALASFGEVAKFIYEKLVFILEGRVVDWGAEKATGG